MNGFETVPWEGKLPYGGPAARTYEDAVAAWHSCWQGADVNQMISNLRDCQIIQPSSTQSPTTQTRSGVIRQAWICSPWTAFGPYGFDEAAKIRTGWSRLGARAGSIASSAALAAALPDRCFQVRNFMFSTPIHPPRQQGMDLAIHMQSLAETSGVPVLCRGLAQGWRAEEIRDAKSEGLLAVPTRVVWLFDGARRSFLDRHNTRMDLTLARKARPLRLTDPSAVEPWVWERFADLYAQLYLEKHNRLNPAYTANFMKLAAISGLIEFLVFPSAEGTGFDAFVGLFSGAGQSTCPLVGVETREQKPRGLYRMCCALCFGLAATREHQLNFSSGAGQFKRLRGGEQSVEYALLAVPKSAMMKRRFWTALSHAVERWVVPLLLKEGL
jgi:hypothetical protein